MNRLWLFVWLIIFPLSLSAQTDITDSMNTERFWKTITYKDYDDVLRTSSDINLPDADTMIIVASNRVPYAQKVRFMSEERNDGKISYYAVFLKNEQWNVWKMDFPTAISCMKARNRDWIVYTEGFGKIFTTGLYRGLNLAVQHQLNVIYLDYPSFSTKKQMLGNYGFALSNAKIAGDDFLPVFGKIKQYREEGKMGNGRLTLFFHSMGNNVIRELAKKDKLGIINQDVWVDNLVLNSACVPEKNHAEWVDKIQFAKRIYINYNPEDFTLAGAKLMSLTRQLGEGARGTLSKRATYVNFNQLCGVNHSNFIQLLSHFKAPQTAIAYYHIIFHGRKVNVNDEKYFVTSNFRKLGYSIVCKKESVKPNIEPEANQKNEPIKINSNSSFSGEDDEHTRSGASTSVH